MSEKYIEKYQKDKTEFVAVVKDQLKEKTNTAMESIKKAIGSSIIKSTQERK